MAPLTITLSEARLSALREAAAERVTTIGHLIDEILEVYAVKATRSAEQFFAKARARASLGEAEAVRLAD